MSQNLSFLNRKFIFYTLPLFLFVSCNTQREKSDFKRSVQICDELYIEVYRTFGSGAFGSDLVDDYLTDSTSFRIRIGNYDEYYGRYSYHCDGDSIIIEKSEKSDTSMMHTIEKATYSLNKLRALQNIVQKQVQNISNIE